MINHYIENTATEPPSVSWSISWRITQVDGFHFNRFTWRHALFSAGKWIFWSAYKPVQQHSYNLPPRKNNEQELAVSLILIIRNWPIFSLLFVFFSLKFPVTHFRSHEKKKKEKMNFCSCRRAVTESYNRDRGKQNGAIVTIFSLITIILVYKSRKDVLNLLLSRGCFQRVFSSSRWLW